jgi:O-antigen/teichoic acid export membrane protein
VSLRQKAITSLLWDYSGQVMNMGISLITAVVLSRLLEPEAFGLIGMVTIFTTLAYMLTNFGFGSALIQSQEVDKSDLSTVFFFNIVLGLVLTVILFFLAPLISAFFSEPYLVHVTRFMSFTFLVTSFNIIPITLLSKDINYKSLMLTETVAALSGGVMGITLAMHDFGVWSIAFQLLTMNVIKTSLLWNKVRWWPNMEFNFGSLKKLFRYGSQIFGSQAIATFFAQLDNLIIGKLFSAGVLGYYTRGKRFQEMPVQSLSNALRVYFPILSRMQDDPARMRAAILKSTRITAQLVLPVMAGLIILAEPMVRVLLTDKWLPSVIYIQLLSIVGIAGPLSSLYLNVVRATGRVDILLKLEFVKQLIGLTAMVVGVLMGGVIGLVVGRVISGYINFSLNIHYCGREIGISIASFVKEIFGSVLLSICLWAIFSLFQVTTDLSTQLEFFGGIIAIPAVYLLLSYLFQREQLLELKTIINENILKIKTT